MNDTDLDDLFSLFANNESGKDAVESDDILFCECHCVSTRDIRLLLEAGMDIESAYKQLNIGTGCGSCVK